MNGVFAATRIAAGLARNGLRYRCLKMLDRPGRPQAVSLEVTHRCVCRCLMCNIWKIPVSVADLPLEDWVGLLSSDLMTDLRELDITGGEPFLRDDLVELVAATCALKHSVLGRLRSVAITTNGVLSERVLTMTAGMAKATRQAGLELVMVCGLDAVGEAHDSIRRHKGAWAQVDRTIAGLVELRSTSPNLIVGVKTTVVPQNIDELGRIARYALGRGLFTIISPAIVTGGRYLNSEEEQDLTLSATERERLAVFCEGPDFKWSYHASTLARYLRTGRMEKPCTCGLNYFFVRSDGTIYLCPLFEESAGVLQAGSAVDAFYSRRACSIRKKVGRAPECARCTEPGLERYSLPYEGFIYLRTLLSGGPRAFLEQHCHLGLDKYV